MSTIAEMLNAAPGTNLTPESTKALGDGEAITPQIEAAITVAA